MQKHIWVGNDHGGFEMKQSLVPLLEELGCTVTDVGTDSAEIVRYPYYAVRVAQAVADGRADGGILICSTGIGMSIIANKIKGVRAALCTDSYMAKMTRRHNNANVLCLGGQITGQALALDIVREWLANEYEGGRHAVSLSMIAREEDAVMAGEVWTPPDKLGGAPAGEL